MRKYKVSDEVLLARDFPSAYVVYENGKNGLFPLKKGMKGTIIKTFANVNAFRLRFLYDEKVFYYPIYKDELL